MTTEPKANPSIGFDKLANQAKELRKLFRSWGFNTRLERTTPDCINIFLDESWDPVNLMFYADTGKYILWGFTYIWEQIEGKEDEDAVYEAFIKLSILNDYHWDLAGYQAD